MGRNGFYMHNRGRYFVQQLQGADRTAPTAPTNLAASSITATTLTLTWTASTDAVGVTQYEVQQRLASGVNGDYVTIATVAAPTVTLAVTGLIGNTEYRFRVRARDAAGNQSAWGPSDDGLLTDTFVFVAPAFNGEVYVMTPDGAGGAWVGGTFLQITDANGVQSRARIAHLDAYGNVTSWDPGSDQSVLDIVIADADYVAVAKVYNATLANNTLGGFDCRGLGLVHRVTGVALAWDPAITRNMYALAVADGRLFRAGAAATGNLRSYTLSTRVLDAWNPSANMLIEGLAVDGTDIITSHAGSGAVGGQTRRYFARTSQTVSAGGVAGFNVNVDPPGFTAFYEGGAVHFVDNGKMIVTGRALNQVDSQVVLGAAIVDRATGVDDTWSPNGSGVTNDWSRSGVGFNRVIAATGNFGTNVIRIFDQTTGAQIATGTCTGVVVVSSGSYAKKFWIPVRRRAVVYGGMTALTTLPVSGTSRMFVIDVP